MSVDDLKFFMSLKVKGVTFENRQDIISRMDVLDRIVLKRERDNEYDGAAIAVYTIRNEQIGYIDKEVSMELAKIIDQGRKVVASISKIMGGSGYYYGVVLDLYVEKEKEIIFHLFEDESPSIFAEFIENLQFIHTISEKDIRFLEIVLDSFPKTIQTFNFFTYYILENYKVNIDFSADFLNHAEIIWYETLLKKAEFLKENLKVSHFIKLLLIDLYFHFQVKEALYYLRRLDKDESGLEDDIKVMLKQSNDELARFIGNELDNMCIHWNYLISELI